MTAYGQDGSRCWRTIERFITLQKDDRRPRPPDSPEIDQVVRLLEHLKLIFLVVNDGLDVANAVVTFRFLHAVVNLV